VEWTDAGLNGVVRFLQRVWRLVLEPETIVVEGTGADGSLLSRKAAQTVKKVTDHYDELRFNTAVAALMELANAMQAYLQNGGSRDAGWDSCARVLVTLLNPLAPHVCEEMWERLGEAGMLADSAWPAYDAEAAAVPEVTVVVQVSGKLRDRLSLPAGTSQAKVLEAAMASDRVRSAFDGGKPSRVVFVPDRLINLVP
jgi:leucyl-tRNA synthetase